METVVAPAKVDPGLLGRVRHVRDSVVVLHVDDLDHCGLLQADGAGVSFLRRACDEHGIGYQPRRGVLGDERPKHHHEQIVEIGVHVHVSGALQVGQLQHEPGHVLIAIQSLAQCPVMVVIAHDDPVHWGFGCCVSVGVALYTL